MTPAGLPPTPRLTGLPGAGPAPAKPAQVADAGAAVVATASSSSPDAIRLGAYGGFALPLAFAALPLYVQWPAHAASAWGMPLATLGMLLLAVRLGDAFVDPWIGARIDGLFQSSARRAWIAAGAAAGCIGAGLCALMFAPAAVRADADVLLAWAAAALVITSLGYSVAMVTHQAWAVRLGGSAADQARWVGAREALALTGVILASVLPAYVGWAVTLGAWGVLAAATWLALRWVQPGRAPRDMVADATPREARRGVAEPAAAPARVQGDATAHGSGGPWSDRGFRRLIPIVLLGGLASAIPASLVVLYVRDVLAAAGAAEGWTLGLYFTAGVLAMPLWVRAVGRFGLLRTWLAGMAIAIAAFAGAALLGPGDIALFAVVCMASGLALGADLVVPPALLAGLIQRRSAGLPPDGAEGAAIERGVEGQWFGWWNFVTKLTLAGAAGIALPIVQWLGYSPGDQAASSLGALTFSYAVLPCAIKAAAAVLLWTLRDTWPWAWAPAVLARPAR